MLKNKPQNLHVLIGMASKVRDALGCINGLVDGQSVDMI